MRRGIIESPENPRFHESTNGSRVESGRRARRGEGIRGSGSEKAPIKAGKELRMKEPHGKGVANRSNPESCAGGGNIAGEALTHGTRRPAIELRNQAFGVPTLF